MWGIIFYLGKTLNWEVLGLFMETSTFLSLNCPLLHSGQFRDKTSLDLHEKPLQVPNLRVLPVKKNNHPHFQKERCINSY